MIDPSQAQALREARTAAKQAALQEERETQHREARAAYKAQQRAAYPGTDALFSELVWPDKLKAFEQAAAKDPAEAIKADLLARHRYHGF